MNFELCYLSSRFFVFSCRSILEASLIYPVYFIIRRYSSTNKLKIKGIDIGREVVNLLHCAGDNTSI